MFRTLRYIVGDSFHRYLKQEGLFRTLGIIRRRLTYRVKRYVYEGIYLPVFRMGAKPTRKQLKFAVHLTDHCNLNCAECSHFAPLAEEFFLDLETFRRDTQRIAKLFDGKIEAMYLMGGEPLLHPKVEEFFTAAREAFPDASKAPVELVTNGLLLNGKDDGFWRSCSENKIAVVVTVYPCMEEQFRRAKAKGASFGVEVRPFSDFEGADQKRFYHFGIDLEGKGSAMLNFAYCHSGNECIVLRNGRLYTCTSAAYVHLFNKYFEKSVPVTDKDSIDIYTAGNGREILRFLARPIPFCRFCKIDECAAPWRISKREISEWSA
ncbi:MAG: hypothetical protein LBR38_07775 [Synergistaceae bacterium]|jgi:hypothetical protein|nr:hypothetical protein [Synergistaceae bacterium]